MPLETGAKESTYRRAANGGEDASTVSRRQMDVNGGRSAYEIRILAAGLYEVGPFGFGGVNLQFGNADWENPFSGTYVGLISRSLKPGTMVRNGRDEYHEMQPPAIVTDFDGEVAAPAMGAIMHIDGFCSRVRLQITDFDPGLGGELVLWVL
jgi:hypothetical protein